MIFIRKKSITQQIREILELSEEQEVKCLIKYKHDGYTFVLSNDDNKAIDVKVLENNTAKKKRSKKEEEL